MSLFFLLMLTMLSSVFGTEVIFRRDSLFEYYSKRADSLALYDSSRWFALLHLHSGFLSPVSDVDGGLFFLAENGKTDRRAELHATLRAFLSSENLQPQHNPADSSALHPLARYRARFLFLNEHLNFRKEDLPDVDLSRWLRWKNSLDPGGVSFIFASSYLNNPASAMGHTFLRINTKGKKGALEILNYGVTWAADVDLAREYFYVIKGPAGFYDGTFGLMPYYVSLQKYSHMESRDIWEYPLNLDSAALDLLLAHIWEMGATKMDYFFFTENCSYNMMTLLQVPLDTVDLSENFGPIVVPIETIKRLLEIPGLVSPPTYRPAQLTRLVKEWENYSAAQREFMQKIIGADSVSPRIWQKNLKLSDSLAVLAYDQGLEYVQLKKRSKGGHWINRQRKLLLERRHWPRISRTADAEGVSSPSAPHESHAPKLISLGGGMDHGDVYSEVLFRLSYHDLLGNPQGFQLGQQIQAFQLALRLRSLTENRPEAALEEIRLIQVQSVTPWHPVLRPLSWRVDLSYNRFSAPGLRQKYAALLEGGVGWAIKPARNLILYSFAELRIRAARWIRYGASAGPKIFGGLLWRNEYVGLLAQAWISRSFFPSHQFSESSLELEMSLRSGRDFEIRPGVFFRGEEGMARLRFFLYF